MKASLLLFGILFARPWIGLASDCDLTKILKDLKSSVRTQYQKTLRNKESEVMARKLRKIKLDTHSYMVAWKLSHPGQVGPWAREGNTLIVGLTTKQKKKWMREVGNKSFGLYVSDLPEHTQEYRPSAFLRVRNKLYPFKDIQEAYKSEKAWKKMSSKNNRFDKLDYMGSEATFFATPEELDAIEEFLLLRGIQSIEATKKIRARGKVVETGEPIHPKFHEKGNSLIYESCAGSCSSFIDPRWLEHIEAPLALKLAALAMDKGLHPEFNSRAFIYSNFRNPKTASITMFGIEQSDRNLTEDFINNHYWSRMGGMMWGFIPDFEGENRSYQAQRYLMKEWLKENKK